MVDEGQRVLEVGNHVEVRNRFDGRWSHGFVVAEVTDRGYRLRRSGEQEVLPAVFRPDQVRREHRRGQWWY